MKYQSKSAIKYMFRNFWHLAPIGLVAAVLFGLFCNTNAEIQLVHQLANGVITSENVLDKVLNAVSIMRFGKYWWCFLISIFVLAFTESLFMVKVERHMRVGEMNRFPLKRALNAFPTVALFVVAIIVLMELLNLVIVGVAFLSRLANPMAITVVSIIWVYLVRMITALLVGTLLLAFPIMFLENYSFTNALSYSVRLMSEKRRYLWLFATLYPVMRFLLSLVCYFVDAYAFTATVFSLFYLMLALMSPCVTFKMYYDTVGGERRDLLSTMFK